MSVDPLLTKYPSFSPYSSFKNDPILFVDPDGREWINAYDALVAKAKRSLLDNLNNKNLQRDLRSYEINQTKVAKVLKDLRSNDLSLYNYVENLSVTDVISGEIIDVKVTVGLDYQSGKYSNEEARTEYNSIMKSGSKHYVNYKSKEPYYDVTPGPINSQDEIGFDITLFSTEDWAD